MTEKRRYSVGGLITISMHTEVTASSPEEARTIAETIRADANWRSYLRARDAKEFAEGCVQRAQNDRDAFRAERDVLEARRVHVETRTAEFIAERNAANARAEKAEAMLCARCKAACKHLCSTPQSIEDSEQETAEAIAAWLDSVAIGHLGNRMAYAAQIRNGNWRHDAMTTEQP